MLVVSSIAVKPYFNFPVDSPIIPSIFDSGAIPATFILLIAESKLEYLSFL